VPELGPELVDSEKAWGVEDVATLYEKPTRKEK
jgi:hypothetical protein